MFNPFVKFELRFLPAFRDSKRRYLVSQTFSRQHDLFKHPDKKYLMLTHYNDKQAAETHLNAVRFDEYAALYDLKSEQEYSALSNMIKEENKYEIYSSLIVDPKKVEDAMNKIFETNIRNYISKRTSWNIPGGTWINPKPELTFGELYYS